ncbi:zf-HC2 domain-containing protein [Micromonospora sp. NPDC003197]
MSHPTDRLAEYAASTLPDRAAAAVAAHLAQCAACRQDTSAWQRIAEGVRDQLAPAPTGLFSALRDRLTPPSPRPGTPPPYRAVPGTRPVARAVGLLAHQWRLVGWRVWIVAALVLAAGTAVAGWATAPAEAVLATVVPLVAALVVAAACGDDDPSGELLRATPTSVRTILLARLTLVLGVIFGAAMVGSLALSLAGAGEPGRLLAAWLGPMVLLSAVSFALASTWRPAVGGSAALALWTLRALAVSGSLDAELASVIEAAWRTTWPALTVAGALVAGALLLLPRLPPLRTARLGR